ncbi:HNH endonuclease signature motif containing protein [Acinetobacter johnsonii]|uniref:HNH endonuclease signature motif containing protein n=1 Tax=Acinetobacter johnsonii TaxID=40214 RepID=UPI001F1F75C6|nr:HNH endonuclease signature motif containing protein [Acinetobacter johnsonii]UIZ98268.1 HNH endonuclease [Acinetobacter johnsonii]
MAKGSAIHYSQEQLDFIKANCTLSRKDLTEKVNGVFGSEFSVDQIKSLCIRNKWKSGRMGCFEKGSKPWNTGTKGVCKPNSGNFKKGQISWNKKPVGYERICSKDGYVLIKIAEPNVFELKHRVIWEKEYGPVPMNQVLAFKNQDKTDCRLDNLILMSRTDMVRYNQSYQKLANPENNESCLLMAKVKNMKHQLLKEVS